MKKALILSLSVLLVLAFASSSGEYLAELFSARSAVAANLRNDVGLVYPPSTSTPTPTATAMWNCLVRVPMMKSSAAYPIPGSAWCQYFSLIKKNTMPGEPTETPTFTPTPSPTFTDTPTFTPTFTRTPTPTKTLKPTKTPTPTKTKKPTPYPYP